MKEQEIKTLQTTVLLLDNVSKFEILKMELGPYIKDAERIQRIIVK